MTTASRPCTGIFAADFYPTPPDVAVEMLDPLDLRGKTVLEPSAGSGNLVRACLDRGAQEVIWCETEAPLIQLLVGIDRATPLQSVHDFLKVTSDQVSHVDLIIMNPPFSADERHILHAWDLAPPGCEIVSLCNWNTVADDRWRSRKEMRQLIDSYGSSINLGSAFAEAERTTDVEIGLVRLTKPGKRSEEEFEGFFLGPDEIEAQGEGLIPYRRSRDLVNRYVEACRIYDEQVEAAERLHVVLSGFFGKTLGMQVTMEGAPVARNRFRKELQKSAWKHVFSEFLPTHMATTQLASDINNFVERQSHIPFTERNLWRMLQVVAGTHGQRIDRAVEEVIDKLTRHSKDNRWNVPGWATNAPSMLNIKMIFPYLAKPDYSGGTVSITRYRGNFGDVQDLIKALCWITGRNYETIADSEGVVVKRGASNPAGGYDRVMPGQWLDWGFFEFRAYKKGTVHLRFKNRDDWAAINKRYAAIKGLVLPEKI